MNSLLLQIEQAIRRISLASAMILLPALIVVRLVEVYTRAWLNQPGSYYNALERELFLLLILLTIGGAYVSNAHVRVDVLRERFSAKARSLIELLGGLLFVLPFGAVVIWYGTDLAVSTMRAGERAAITLGAPLRWMLVAAVPLGIELFVLAVVTRMLRHLFFLTGDLPDPNAQVTKPPTRDSLATDYSRD
ncbi:MAG: TRAP transporter small permease subunit [Burkholderiaceae bacterium]